MSELTEEEKIQAFLLAHPEFIEACIPIIEPLIKILEPIFECLREFIIQIMKEVEKNER